MIVFTDEEWQAHQQQIAELTTQLTEVRRHLAAAQQRIAELEATKTPPPAFAKANRPEKPPRERQKRARAESRPSP